MKKNILVSLILISACFFNIYSQEKIIFDTDFDSDIDDVGALYMLHTFADRGDVQILATILSTTHFWSPFALDAVNTFRGRPDIPIGAPFIEGVNKGSVYAETIAKEFPNDLGASKDIEEATHLYRRILSSEEDGSVTLVSVGHLTNIAGLLESKADELSPLTGKELVQKKVKMWVAMLGEGMNWNMKWDRVASEIAINECPVPIVFTVDGQEVKTGKQTQNLEDNNPIKTVYRLWEKHYGEIDRSSWDQISTLYAINGESDYFKVKKGNLEFSLEQGAQWKSKAGGKDLRLYNRISNEELAGIIESLMIQTPLTEKKQKDSNFTLWQLPSQVNTIGNSYVFQMSNGKIAVMDGGMMEETAYLKGFLAALGNEVEAWFISHPHNDHMSALNQILMDPDDIRIKTIYHSALLPSFYQAYETGFTSLTEDFYRNLDSSGIHVVNFTEPGTTIVIDQTKFKILSVSNPDITVNPYNNSSMAIRVWDAKKSMVFLGDMGKEGGDRLLNGPYRDDLDCDYLQMAHHGQQGVSLEFYRTIKFRACLWPTPTWVYDNDQGEGFDTGPLKTIEVRELMDELGIQEHYRSFEGLIKLN